MQQRLDFGKIEAILWDQDLTLALLSKAALERGVFGIAKQHLLTQTAKLGLPAAAVRTWRYLPNSAQYGLVIDKETGHTLKLNAQQLPVRAALGRRQRGKVNLLRGEALPELIEQTYGNRPIELHSQSGTVNERFLMVDSSFHMARLQLFELLVGLKVSEQLNGDHPYQTLFQWADHAVDTANGDTQLLKKQIMLDPMRFVSAEERTTMQQIAKMMGALRRAGKRMVLVTNSSPTFSQAVMNAFYGDTWEGIFDLRFFLARKPSFFDGTNPAELITSFQRDKSRPLEDDELYQPGEAYRGGNLASLLRSLALEPSQVLHCGDEARTEIHAAKRQGLNTALVASFLATDRQLMLRYESQLRQLDQLRAREDQLMANKRSGRKRHNAAPELASLRRERRELEATLEAQLGPWLLATRGSTIEQPSILAQLAAEHADLVVPTAAALGEIDPHGVLEPRPLLSFMELPPNFRE